MSDAEIIYYQEQLKNLIKRTDNLIIMTTSQQLKNSLDVARLVWLKEHDWSFKAVKKFIDKALTTHTKKLLQAERDRLNGILDEQQKHAPNDEANRGYNQCLLDQISHLQEQIKE